MPKKGFIHLVEILIITLVVFLLMNQFSYIPSSRYSWEREKLWLLGNDALFSLEKAGIDWFDKTQVENSMARVLDPNIRYSLSVRTPLKPNITVGCLCNTSELAQVSGALTGFAINNRTVSFDVEHIEQNNPSLSVANDVVVIGQDAYLEANNTRLQNELATYLSTGRGVIAVTQFEANAQLNSVFGLGKPSGGAQDFTFSEQDSADGRLIERLFSSIPGSAQRDFEHVFTVPANNTAKAQKGFFALVKSSDSDAAVIGHAQTGKVGWIYQGQWDREEKNLLLKSMVLWAAPDFYQVAGQNIKRPVTFSLYKTIGEGEHNPGMFELIEIVLKLEYAF